MFGLLATSFVGHAAGMRTVYRGACGNGYKFTSSVLVKAEAGSTGYVAELRDSGGTEIAHQAEGLYPLSADTLDGGAVYNFKLIGVKGHPYEVIIQGSRSPYSGAIIKDWGDYEHRKKNKCKFSVANHTS